MYILFQNGNMIPIIAEANAFVDQVNMMFKHLQHIDIPFKDWDSHLYRTTPLKTIAENLVEHAKALGIDADLDRCRAQDQDHLNNLHRCYELGYNGDPSWLTLHEHIHLCEQFGRSPANYLITEIDYREKAGMLEKKYNPEWLVHGTTKVEPGDVYMAWSELGKTPYSYWLDGEPHDPNRVCELAKPWLILRPKLFVVFGHIDFLAMKCTDQFNQWWQLYHDDWCKHWNLSSWSIQNMCTVNIIGKIADIEAMESLLDQKIYPIRIKIT